MSVCIAPAGLLFHLGTLGGTRAWRNPAEAATALIKVTASSVQGDSRPATAICGREVCASVCAGLLVCVWLA